MNGTRLHLMIDSLRRRLSVLLKIDVYDPDRAHLATLRVVLEFAPIDLVVNVRILACKSATIDDDADVLERGLLSCLVLDRFVGGNAELLATILRLGESESSGALLDLDSKLLWQLAQLAIHLPARVGIKPEDDSEQDDRDRQENASSSFWINRQGD